MGQGMLQDDNGNISSLRIVLVIILAIFIYLLALFTQALKIEIVKETPNYTGLATLFTAMLVNLALPLLLKVIQKKYEK